MHGGQIPGTGRGGFSTACSNLYFKQHKKGPFAISYKQKANVFSETLIIGDKISFSILKSVSPREVKASLALLPEHIHDLSKPRNSTFPISCLTAYLF